MSSWGVLLNGVYIAGGCDDEQWAEIQAACESPDASPGDAALSEPAGILSVPPAGLGLPNLRTEDVAYPQRDGVRHFADWYEPRIITLEGVTVCNDGCGCDGDNLQTVDPAERGRTAREKVRAILQAWSRQCDDVELVIFTDCHDADLLESPESPGESPGSPDRSLYGPFGIIGRPRVAEVEWQRSDIGCAVLTLRFDARDHRMFVLDECGNPGSGVECVTLTPDIDEVCGTFPMCFDGGPNGDAWCFNVDEEVEGNDAIATVVGTECVGPTITLCGTLTDPVVENVRTGRTVGYRGTIRDTDPCVVIDTENGTATQGGASRTHLLTGDPRLLLEPGDNLLRLTSFAANDDGYADVCWRSEVVTA